MVREEPSINSRHHHQQQYQWQQWHCHLCQHADNGLIFNFCESATPAITAVVISGSIQRIRIKGDDKKWKR